MIQDLLLVFVFVTHYVGDFPLQSFFQQYMGQKHKSLLHLLNHVLMYGFTITVGAMLLGLPWWFGPVNALLHGVVDFFTSKASHKCHDEAVIEEKLNLPSTWRGAFWCVIGFDQLIHACCLVLTAGWALAT